VRNHDVARSVAGALALCGVLAVVGCSSLAKAEHSAAPESFSSPASPSAPAVTAATTCVALSEPSSLAFNAPRDFEKGAISAEERDAQLAEAKQLFSEIATPDGSIETALTALNAYLESAPPAEDGATFDAHAFEYVNLESRLASACEAAGENLVIQGHGG
jgi:hypothetical protein